MGYYSFCQQVDDWMRKITEKIIRRNVFEQKKKITGLSANHAFEQPRSVEHL